MDHGPAVEHEQDPASGFKTKIGLILFLIYGLIYAGFIAINTLKPRLMEMKVLLGVNLAVVYGFGLILLAIILGLVYNTISTRKEKELNTADRETDS